MTERCDVEIAPASSPHELEEIRDLWREYWESLRLPPDFQNFAGELASLPGAYAEPKGRLLLARVENQPAGSAAFRPLDERSCEAKRLYVRPQYRRKGIGKALLDRLLTEARAAGYTKMYADTLRSMASAMQMYREIGFAETAPYSSNPTPGAIFLELQL